MVNLNKMDALAWLRKHLDDDGNDLLRDMVRGFAEQLMAAEVDMVTGAGWGEVSPDRVNHRNGYRMRPFDTRVGTIALGSASTGGEGPRRGRGLSVTSAGVSTRRVDGLVKTLGIESLSKSQVSRMAGELDEMVAEFRNRPLDAGPYTYVWMDALTQKVREGGRIINVAVVIAVGVNVDGHREVLGIDVITTEDGAGWLAFLRGLVARGLSGVSLVVSDAHPGLVDAIASTLPGASWQRCRTHYMRNLLTKVPKSAQAMVATLVRTIFAQPDATSVRAQFTRVVDQLAEQFADAADHLADAGPDVLAFAGFPKEHWRQIWSNNPQERLNKELRRRTDVVGIFPNRDAVIRLVGAVLAEQHDVWAVARRYMSTELLTRARMHIIETDLEEVTQHALTEAS